jgi:hypothetical protein
VHTARTAGASITGPGYDKITALRQLSYLIRKGGLG